MAGESWVDLTQQLTIKIRDLQQESDRLRALIVKAEWSMGDDNGEDCLCPWCGGLAPGNDSHGIPRDGVHGSDCPAFSAPGVPR